MCAARKTRQPPDLLKKQDPKPWEMINPRGKGQGLIVCDHAAKRLPVALKKDFGVCPADLKRHIGWDIGAADVSRHIAKKLDMPGVLGAYSRLVVDLNRAPKHPQFIPAVSDNTPVPGNENLTAAQRKAREAAIFKPYHGAVSDRIDGFLDEGRVPLLLFIHSYTPEMDGEKRPWHVGIMWNREKAIAKKLMAGFKAVKPGIVVGDNKPYSLQNEYFADCTPFRHAEDRGLPYVFIEFRQDLVDTPLKATRWGNMFIKALQPVLDDPKTFRLRKI
ncbi:MAG: N-formylglutamate amidohydrolase [Alphaproteobacteria bacterium]|nr:N-formylglutamate amidohydrolase [Alphaproteobacteria bacterium]